MVIVKGVGNREASRRPNRQIKGVPEKVIQEIFPELKKKAWMCSLKGFSKSVAGLVGQAGEHHRGRCMPLRFWNADVKRKSYKLPEQVLFKEKRIILVPDFSLATLKARRRLEKMFRSYWEKRIKNPKCVTKISFIYCRKRSTFSDM